MKGLYIHIPFCDKICNYCDFTKMVSTSDVKIKYVNRLKDEFKYRLKDLSNIDTVFIGGGTPNSLSIELLEEVLVFIKEYIKNSKETTIELNPDLLNIEQIMLFKKYGINRISLGVESFNSNLLKLLGRCHNKEMVYEKIKLLKDNGFDNINIDLIFGIPGETIDDVKYDLECFKELDIKHLSYYSLILEDKTIFSYMLNNKKIELLDDDIVADMYDYINKFMNENGYHHYEISNYAKPGYESIHNKLYWTEQDYVGIGLGASGFIDKYRYNNQKLMKDYLKNFEEKRDFISLDEEKSEYLIFGLRMVDGISISDYEKRYNSNPFEDFKIEKLIKNKLLIIDGDYLKINPDKLFISNLVFEELLNEG